MNLPTHNPRQGPTKLTRPSALPAGWLLPLSLVALLIGGFLASPVLFVPNTPSPATGRNWTSQGWHWDPASHQAYFYGVNLTVEECEQALSKDTLLQVASQSGLERVTIAYDAKWKLDLSPLNQAKAIQSFHVNCLSTSPKLFDQLAALKVKKQFLFGDLRAADLSPLCRSTALDELFLNGDLSAQTVESLSESEHLQSLTLGAFRLAPDEQPITKWPKSLSKLAIGAPINARSFESLKSHSGIVELLPFNWVLDGESLVTIASIPTLRKTWLHLNKLSGAELESLLKMNCDELVLQVDELNLSAEATRGLARVKGLSLLDLSTLSISNDVAESLCGAESLTDLRITSPFVSEATILKLARLPKLKFLQVPTTMRITSVRVQVNEIRQELQLPPLGITNASLLAAEPPPVVSNRSP